MAKKNSKIIRYKKKWNLDLGVIIFAFIFVYLVASVISYVSKDEIHVYEVVSGSLANYADYTALILRDETVTSCENSGYLSFYVRDGKKVGANDLVYTIDESGRVLDLLSQTDSENSLSSDDLKALKNEVSQFAMSYDSLDFSAVYDMKSSISATLLEYVNAETLEELLATLPGTDTSTFIKYYTPVSGVLSLGLDGMEGLTAEEVTAADFDTSSYEKKQLNSGQMVESGTPVYKMIGDEEWYLIIPLSDEDVRAFSGLSTVNFSFTVSQLETSGTFEMYTGADGGTYGKITLNRYMVQYLGKRYVNIEIETSDIEGLKIPASSVVYKDFYQVPKEYLTSDGVVLVENYDTDGTLTVERVTPVTYSADEDYCYLDAESYEAGQNVAKEDSNDRYTLSRVSSLPGVYNVNKGYVIFRKILILDEGEEYDIISSPESSVSVYDHIVLNSDTVYEGQIIYY